MQIKLLRLKKFKRLMTSNIQEFEWTPTKNVMLMLGSNGSGKSSIMDELTPLPSRHNNFDKGGEKEYHGFHNGNLYVLLSKYGHGTGLHSFKRNNEELNSGGTFKVQEELCLQEFNETREIHEISTGKIKFTNMSTSKRREILTRMSTVDLSYALDVFRDLKTEHRSQKGVIDLITKRLVSENHDIPSDGEMSLMREETTRLTKRLNALFQEKRSDVKPAYNSVHALQCKLAAIISEANECLTEYTVLPAAIKVANHGEFQNEFNRVSEQYSAINAVINRLAEELDKLRSDSPVSVEVTEDEVNNLKAIIKDSLATAEDAVKVMGSYNGQFPIVKFNTAGADPFTKLDGMFDRWFELMVSFPDNGDGWMSREEATQKQERQRELRNVRMHIDNKIEEVNSRLSRLKGCETVVCPKCEHDFKPGIDPNEGESLEASKRKLYEAQEKLDKEFESITEYLEKFQDYSSYVFQFVSLTKDYPEFADLWDYCATELIMFRTPAVHKTDALQWHTAMRGYVESKVQLEVVNNTEKRLKVIAEIDKDAIGYMKRRAEELETEINVMYVKASDISTYLSDLRTGERSILANNEKIHRLLDDYEQWQIDVRNQAEYLLDKAYTEEINHIQVKLAETSRTLNTMEQRETTIRTLENEVSLATEIHQDLALLIKALSPNGGLLGRYMLGFLQGVTFVVNAYIEEVWTYPMEVLPSRIEKEDLDYNFPLKVAGGAVMAQDISYGSDSQLEIVNFGYMMAIMKFLGMEDRPLFLDEFGRTFDEQHRANLIPFISRLVENGQVKQIFYISHFESTHGAFNQAETMVVDPTNITVPELYNKNVVIR